MSQYSQARKINQTTIRESIGKLYKYIKPKATILDVGCSSGYFGEMLIKGNDSVVDGIEYDEKDAQKARKVLNKVFSFDLDSETWPKELSKQTYDIIFFGDVLEHLKNPGKVLENFISLLKPNGKVIISIPNIAHISVRLELLAGNFEYEKMGILDETHLKYFTFASFSRLLSDSGYKILDYDESIIPLPRATIDSALKDIGLSANESFYDFITKSDALAFQYKFVAEPGKAKSLPKLAAKPVELGKIDATKIEQLYADIELLKLKENELVALKQSKSWQITKPLRAVKQKLRRKDN